MRFLSLILLGLCPCVDLCLWSCGRLWSVCEVVVVPYVDAVVAVIVMRVLLFVLHVCLLTECDGARLTAILVWGMDEEWCGWCSWGVGRGLGPGCGGVVLCLCEFGFSV